MDDILKEKRILIVDDEQRYADMLARRLGLRGLVCEVRYDGQTAIDTVAEIPFPAVILDLQLPDLYSRICLSVHERCSHQFQYLKKNHWKLSAAGEN